MAGADCYKLVRGKVARVTKVDRCGSVIPGPLNQVTTEGVISVQYTNNYDAGNPIVVPNVAGKNLIDDTPTPRFRNQTDVISLLGVNPLLVAMLTSQDTWEGVVAGTVTGFTIGDDVDPDAAGFAIETWSGVQGVVCEDGVVRYGYFLQPWLKGGQVDAITWANDAINFTVSNAVTQAPNDWGVGPYDVMLDENGLPAPLPRVLGERKHFLSTVVDLEPPADECGAGPVGVPPTGATAGTPGTFTPSGSWAALNLADLSDVTASPTSAWTTGQRVNLADGTSAHWTGAAWAAGPAA